MIYVLALSYERSDTNGLPSFRKRMSFSEPLEWILVTNKEMGTTSEEFPWMRVVSSEPRQFVSDAWALVPSEADFILQLPSDHELEDYLDLDVLVEIMEEHPYLAQLSLTGAPEDAVDRGVWVEHTSGWSSGPSLYRRAITELGWRPGRNPEKKFTDRLYRNSDAWRFGTYKGDLVTRI